MTPDDPIGLAGYTGAVAVATGGSSTVWRAREVALNRWVAVKVLSQPVLDDDLRRRFSRELALAGALSGHPNVVTVYGSGFTADGRAYIASEWCPSGSVGDLVALHGPLSPAQVAAVGADVAAALAAAHEQAIVHRDVKPANVVVTAYGKAALADFGIASSGLDATAPTNSLTPVHAAPEVLQGVTASPPADVWGLGSTLWSALVGTAPFAPQPGEGVLPTMLRIQADPPPALPASVPAPLAALLLRMLSKDAGLRPTAAHAAAELRVLAEGAAPLPLRAAEAPPAPAAVPDVDLTVSRGPRAVAAAGPVGAGALTPLLAAGTAAAGAVAAAGEHTVHRPLAARPADASAPEPEPEKRRGALVLAGAVVLAGALVAGGLVLGRDGDAPATPVELAGSASEPSPSAVPSAGASAGAPAAGGEAPALPVLDAGAGAGGGGIVPLEGVPVGQTSEIATAAGVVSVAPPAPVAPPGSTVRPPAPPSALAVTGGDGTLSITWRQGANGGAAVTSQTVRSATGQSWTVAGNAVGFRLDDQANGRQVCVTVAATSAAGTSAPSGRACGTPRAGAPGQPTSIAVTSGDAAVAASWGAAADGSRPVTGYVATLNPGGVQRTTTASARSASFTGLRNGTAYTVSVVARTSTATGPARSSAATVPSRVPYAPALEVSAGNGTITGSWAAPDDGGSPITGYRVSVDGANVKVLAAGARSYRYAASNDRSHTFAVYPVNARGRGTGASGSAVPRAPQPVRTAIYRCSNSAGNSLYTRRSNCEGSSGYTLRGSPWKISTGSFAGTTPLYRLFKSGAHVMTLDPNEKNALVRNGWNLDGTIGYVRTTSAYGWTRVTRMVRNSYHVYATDGDVQNWRDRGYAVESRFWV